MGRDLVGWLASLVLLATLVQQNVQLWRSGNSGGVSRWLFLGQTAASAGFTVYSVMLRNWVFVATNAALLINGLVGQAIDRRNRRRSQRDRGSYLRSAVPA